MIRSGLSAIWLPSWLASVKQQVPLVRNEDLREEAANNLQNRGLQELGQLVRSMRFGRSRCSDVEHVGVWLNWLSGTVPLDQGEFHRAGV